MLAILNHYQNMLKNKIFKRISDGLNFDNEIYLGYTYYIDGKKLPGPKLDVIEDFEEVEDIYNKDQI